MESQFKNPDIRIRKRIILKKSGHWDPVSPNCPNSPNILKHEESRNLFDVKGRVEHFESLSVYLCP